MGRGGGGAGAREKRRWEGYRRQEIRGWEREPGGNRDGTKRCEPLRKGAVSGSKWYGKWEVQTPLPPK